MPQANDQPSVPGNEIVNHPSETGTAPTPRTDALDRELYARQPADSSIEWAEFMIDKIIVALNHGRELEREIAALRRGEFICSQCGIRKDGEVTGAPDF